MSRSLVIACSLALAAQLGCSVQPGEGQFACEDGLCPPGWFCRADRRCYSSPEGAPDASVDARAPDDVGRDSGVDAPVDAPMAECTGEGSVCTRLGGGAGLCCGGLCIDPNNDPTHCGTCTNDCSGSESPRCVTGRCAECMPGLDLCNDSVACTADSCSADGACVHAPDHNVCPPVPADGAHDCLAAAQCTTSGCGYSVLGDGAVCRNGGPSREFCFGGVCNDSHACGYPEPSCCTRVGPEAFCRFINACNPDC